LIKFDKFSCAYGGKTGPALEDINLEICDGEFVLITGPSGSGKSSLCRCLNGLIPHFYGGTISGSLEVQGLNPLEAGPAKMASLVGMVFQNPENQIVTSSVERELAFGLENLAFPRGLISRRIEESLDTLGIFNLRRRTIPELSGGEKQKVAIASVLALHPEVLVLDEPTSELDPQSAEDVLSNVQRLNEDLGLTVILIEHRLDRILNYVDRLVVLDQKKIFIDCSLREGLDKFYPKIVELGIGVPPVVCLAKELAAIDIKMDKLPLTVREGRRELEKIISIREIKPLPPVKKTSGKVIIRTEKLNFSYPEHQPVLKDLDLEIFSGEITAIMGRNASGKSTLIRHFNGLLKPTRGKVLIDNQDTRQKEVSVLARKIGFVFQNPDDHLFSETVEEEIGFALHNFGYKKLEIETRIVSILEKFKLSEYRFQYPRSLSGGEKQRVALASVLVLEPEILILDEPTRGMSGGLKNDLMRFLKGYAGNGRTVVLVTHDVEMVAEYADRVILISEGELVISGRKSDVLSGGLLFSPQVNRLVQPFAKKGISENILTVSELVETLK
jgi:energy-coupling factor transport system ATP-binding protein